MSGPLRHHPLSTTRRGSCALGFLILLALTHAQSLGPGAAAQGISGDLTVVLDVPGASSTPGVGATISVTDVTRNVSANPAGASTTRIYLSASSTFDLSAIPVGARSVPPLGPGETSTGPAQVILPADQAGVRYFFAVADADNTVSEGNEGNNVSAAWQILIGGDLIVWIDVPGSITSAMAGSTVVVSDWTRSDNSAPVGASTTRFYLVRGTTIDASAIPLESRSIPALPPSTTNTGTTTVTLPASAAGTFRLIAKTDADGSALEVNEGNNASGASQPFTIGPDLIVWLDLPGGSSAVEAGAIINLRDITRNRERTRVEASTTLFYLSLDGNLDLGDILLGSRAIPALEPRTENSDVTPLTIPPGIVGRYFIIAVADGHAMRPESDEANNVGISSAIAIGPDLIVTGTSAPGRASPGSTIHVGDATKNDGEGTAQTSSTAYYLSRDAVLDPGDVLLGSRAMPPLGSRASSVDGTTVVIPAATPPGCHFLIATADAGHVVGESDEGNNAIPREFARTIQIAPGSGVTRACSPVDFDGDGKTDILWRHSAGDVGIWRMDGATLSSATVVASASLDWTVDGVGDFNGDGKADILWRQASTGTVGIWLMDGTTLGSATVVTSASLDWTVGGVGDFNGDGKADILWRQAPTGAVGIWLMNGVSLSSATVVASPPLAWTIDGVGDFNGDGKADILWREAPTGTVAIWLMDGVNIVSAASVDSPPLAWTIDGVGDFNGDGKGDILWREAPTGTVAIWLMDGVSRVSAASVASPPLDWTIDGVGDFDRDGRTDIVWREGSTGAVGIWLMDGMNLRSVAIPTTAGADWVIQ
jgi:hypothetical protein